MSGRSVIKASNEKQLLRFLRMIREYRFLLNQKQCSLKIDDPMQAALFDKYDGLRKKIDYLAYDYTCHINDKIEKNELIKPDYISQLEIELKRLLCEID